MIRRLLGWVRDGWLIIGLTVLLLAALELGYVGQAAVRRGLRTLRGAPEGPVHPNADQPWWREWVVREGAINGPSRYDPYRGFWARPYVAPFVHVDSAGRRVTVHPAAVPGAARVYLLGGSVMWGYTARDSFTVPSLVAARLADAGVGPVEVVNLAQPSYNTTQGLITLLLELRAGRVPTVVVSLDGNNDVLALDREGAAGRALGESDAAIGSAVGWRGFAASVLGLTRYSALARRVMQLARPPRVDRDAVPADPGACAEVAQQYRQLARAAEGLGRQFGFEVWYLWQPHWATTAKRMTPWEAAIRGEGRFPRLMRACSVAVALAMRERPGAGFEDLTHLFDGDTTSVFLDEFGHVTEAGNARIAARIASLVGPLLASQKRRRGE